MSYMHNKGYFYIINRQIGLALGVKENTHEDDPPVVLENKKSEKAENQLWKYNFKTDKLESHLNGHRLEVYGHAVNGAKIISSPENDSENQKWTFMVDGTIQTAMVADDSFVLDVGSDAEAGTHVILYQQKKAGYYQRWDMVPYVPTDKPFYIRCFLNDLYLQIYGRRDKPGVHLDLGAAVSGNRKFQRWKYNKETRAIHSELNDYVIEVKGNKAKNYSAIIVNPGTGEAKQTWTFENNGTIMCGLGFNMVMTDSDYGGAGSSVILHNWHGGKNQQWYISDE